MPGFPQRPAGLGDGWGKEVRLKVLRSTERVPVRDDKEVRHVNAGE